MLYPIIVETSARTCIGYVKTFSIHRRVTSATVVTEPASLDEHSYAIRDSPRKVKRKLDEVIGKLHSAKRNVKTQHQK